MYIHCQQQLEEVAVSWFHYPHTEDQDRWSRYARRTHNSWHWQEGSNRIGRYLDDSWWWVDDGTLVRPPSAVWFDDGTLVRSPSAVMRVSGWACRNIEASIYMVNYLLPHGGGWAYWDYSNAIGIGSLLILHWGRVIELSAWSLFLL